MAFLVVAVETKRVNINLNKPQTIWYMAFLHNLTRLFFIKSASDCNVFDSRRFYSQGEAPNLLRT
jgi:hypothetical protein